MKSLLYILIFVIIFEAIFASRILIVFPTPTQSQTLITKQLGSELAKRGHEITKVSLFPLSKPINNYRDIKISYQDRYKELMGKLISENNKKSAMITNFPTLINYWLEISNQTMHDPQFQKIMQEESFDLVIVGYFGNTFMLGIGDHFKCPTMMISSIGASPGLGNYLGLPVDMSAVPNYFFPVEKMDFRARLKTVFIYFVEYLLGLYTEHQNEKFYLSNFPPEKYVSYDEIKRNVSLILFNDHYTQGRIQAFLPTTVEVGGLQIKPQPSPLPQNLQKWFDGADHGVVFFSLGSNARITFLPKEKVDILLRAFGRLKQRVIFKWEADTLPGKPDNVYIGKWLPQDDILANPKTKLFISHCGIGSVRESKYHAVPILAIPLFTDQMSNADTIVREGWGARVNFDSLNEDAVVEVIEELIQNPKYKEKVKYLSDLYKDRPISAMDTAIYWVEYVLRHKGAPHLHYIGADQNFIERNNLDVFGLIAVAFYIIFKTFILIGKKIVSLFYRRKVNASKKKN